jgi:hypothetical protein
MKSYFEDQVTFLELPDSETDMELAEVDNIKDNREVKVHSFKNKEHLYEGGNDSRRNSFKEEKNFLKSV